MLKILSLLSFILLMSPQNETPHTVFECDVANYFEAVEPERDLKVLTQSGEVETAKLLLKPAKLEEGTYQMKLTRQGSNLYKLENINCYVETRFCYQFGNQLSAKLIVTSNQGYSKGRIYFD